MSAEHSDFIYSTEEERRQWLYTSVAQLRYNISQEWKNSPQSEFYSTVKPKDYLLIFGEWVNGKKIDHPIDQRGFVFEVLANRHIESKDSKSTLNSAIREILIKLLHDHNAQLWGKIKSNPDNIKVSILPPIEVHKIYESKVSRNAVLESGKQIFATMETIESIIKALNGQDDGKLTGVGLEIVSQAREQLRAVSKQPIRLAKKYQYVYLLPSDQHYLPNHPSRGFVTVEHLPISTDDLDQLCSLLNNHLQRLYPKPDRN